jgi:hypothetical protein
VVVEALGAARLELLVDELRAYADTDWAIELPAATGRHRRREVGTPLRPLRPRGEGLRGGRPREKHEKPE